MTDLAALQGDIRALKDRADIIEQYHLYAFLLDDKQWQRIAGDIFAADAEESHGTGMHVRRGREEINAMFGGLMPDIEGSAHYVSNIRVTPTGPDTADAQAYVLSYHWSNENAAQGPVRPVDFVGVGIYLDQWRRDLEGWRIVRRRRRNLGPGPLGHGALPPLVARAIPGWGGSRDQ